MPLDPELQRLSRQCWGSLELLHVLCYLSPQQIEAYRDLGLRFRQGYFASRAAPMGAVGPPLVTSTFYVFAPTLVGMALPSAWEVADPEQIIEVRYTTVTRTLRSILGDADVGPALELVREACAALRPHGRPIYAAHASLGWPDDPMAALFHGSALLREHRGDGHNAVLLQSGLDPVEALITDGLTAGTYEFARTTRGWTDDEWAAGHRRLADRGLIRERPTGWELTADGVTLRADVELSTDVLALDGWQHLGIARCRTLRDLLVPLGRAVAATGTLPDWVARRGS
jgi:hypothetical protein